MLFWGLQGVTPNIRRAVRHYERGAVQLEDPASMYDYGIVLLQVHAPVTSLDRVSFPTTVIHVHSLEFTVLQGQGVEKDIPKAVKFLQKAMDQVWM